MSNVEFILKYPQLLLKFYTSLLATLFTIPCRNFRQICVTYSKVYILKVSHINLSYVQLSAHIVGVSNKFVLGTAKCTYCRSLKQICLMYS